jgi:hypothetical protein
MVDAAELIVAGLGAVCVAIAVWRREYYRPALTGWGLCFTIMGILGFLEKPANGHSRVYLWVNTGRIVSGVLTSWLALRQGKPLQAAAEGETKT